MHCVLMFNVSVYWPTGHFGQDSALGKVQDSEFLASGSESFKNVPGLQQNTRFPGGSERVFLCGFQLELHHTPWLNAAALFKKRFPPPLVILDTSHFEMSELKALAPKNVETQLVTLDTSQIERSELKALAPENVRAR